jgi:hypothetical protein
MDRQLLNRQHHLHVVGNFQYQHQLDVVNLVGLQNLDELNLDADLTCQVAVHLLLVVPADVERHQLRMDYFQDAVGVELRYLKRMDYFRDVVLELLALELLIRQELLHLFQEQLVAQYYFRQSRALARP